ncbi:Uncharacterised protein [Mycobacteroides abscessus subsp. abscessus]|nr:Uncharacterised protein [Mycobacteroides abscessus subsp. abscessus]
MLYTTTIAPYQPKRQHKILTQKSICSDEHFPIDSSLERAATKAARTSTHLLVKNPPRTGCAGDSCQF